MLPRLHKNSGPKGQDRHFIEQLHKSFLLLRMVGSTKGPGTVVTKTQQEDTPPCYLSPQTLQDEGNRREKLHTWHRSQTPGMTLTSPCQLQAPAKLLTFRPQGGGWGCSHGAQLQPLPLLLHAVLRIIDSATGTARMILLSFKYLVLMNSSARRL